MNLESVPQAMWDKAERRARILRPLAERDRCPAGLIDAAAHDLELSPRWVYRLVARLRAQHGAVTALLPQQGRGGPDRPRLAHAVETVIAETIDATFLQRQKPTAAAVIRDVQLRCRKQGIPPPSGSTVRRRLKAIRRADRAARGETVATAQPLHGATPMPNDPLDVVQIDHTKVDLIVVDSQDREPIGRPWITLAIDVYSRCIAGFYLSLDPPSATSVGLCLTHISTDKDAWMAARNVTEVAWPVSGKPQCIGVDNAAEFHSAAFERGCAQHGIDIDWRPLGAPHFGGIVERVIGTFMQRVHQLPGTTFSSPQHRGTYDSENTARLTLDEFEQWLTVAIAKHYHRKAHRGLDGASPLDRYRQGLRDLAATGRAIARPRDPHAYLIDFLPVVRRTLQRDGFTIDHIRYFSNALKPWIEARDPRLNGPWTIRRDPRDLSRIYVLDPTDGSYLEVPYRTLKRPAITLWEHRAARKRLRDRHAARIDEDALFRALEEMRHIEHEARRLTRAERRQRARRQASGQARNEKPIAETEADKPNAADSAEPPGSPPVPFSEIEDW